MFFIERSKLFWKVYGTYIETNKFLRLYCTKVSPGARRRIKLAQDEPEDDPGSLDYEADFETIQQSHKQHMLEMEKQRENLQYRIVKQKYFKNKYPNFLTWHDKEQIRLLYGRDPEEWNVNKLSEGFPALPEVIKKILKSNWKKESLAKIRNHDAVVQENWRKLKNDEFKDLPVNLKEHLNKFSGRDLNFHQYENYNVNDKIEFKATNVCTEFSEIISSYEELKKKKSQRDDPRKIEVHSNDKYSGYQNNNEEDTYIDYPRKIEVHSNDKYSEYQSNNEEDTYIRGTIQNHHLMTLDTLKNKLEKDLESGRQVSYSDIQIVESTETNTNQASKHNVINSPSKDELDSVKYNTSCTSEMAEKSHADYAHLIYPEKINIPKKILKKGCTYKLNDCYYDSDGKFLYRVPGMY